MYPKNAVTPPEIAVGSVYLVADGTIQTTDVLARVRIGTGAWGAKAGTLAVDATSGIWGYIPTQAETNAESFMVAIYKASCTSACVTVVTTASAVAGNVQLAAAQPATTFATLTVSGTTALGPVEITNAVGVALAISGAMGVAITGTAAEAVGIVSTDINSAGMTLTGGGDGNGLSILGGVTGGTGVFIRSGLGGLGAVDIVAGTAGFGIRTTGTGAGGHGIECIGEGTGDGLFADSWKVSGLTTLTGAVSLGSTLTVAGTTTLAALTQVGAVSLGATTFASIVVSGTTTLTGAVSHGGTTTYTGAVVITDQTTALSLGKYLADILGYADVLPGTWVVPGVGTSTLTTGDIDARLAAIHLDHLLATATDIPAVVAGTFYDQLIDDGTATYDRTTDSLQAIRDRGDAAWDTATGFSTHSAVDVYTAFGTGANLTALASATNLATVSTAVVTTIPGTLTTIAGYVDTEVASILAAVDTEIGTLATAVADLPTNTELATAFATALCTTTIAEDYPADGAAATPAELLYLILSCVSQFDITTTTLTTRKLDGTTQSAAFTLDSATTPTSRVRSA